MASHIGDELRVALVLEVFIFVASFAFIVHSIISRKKKSGLNLPPGPPRWPILGNLVEISRAKKPFMCIVKELRKQYGPVFSLQMGQRTLIVVTSAELAHEALIHKGQIFANRPPETPTRALFSSNKCTVNSAEYGALWRTLRRNLVSEMLNVSRAKDFRWVREWALDRLIRRLSNEAAGNGGVVEVLANCRFAVFSILLFMCFGLQFDDDLIRRVDATMKDVLLTLEPRLLDFFPSLAPLSPHSQRVLHVRQMQMANILPIVNKRRQQLTDGSSTLAYVDSLLSLVLEGGRILTDDELVTLCSEFLNGGTDTTAAALEWAMAHLVLQPSTQAALYDEIVSVVGSRTVQEDDVDKMGFLEAVVRETLRMHPPTHFLLSHAVTHPAKLAGFDIPPNASVEFYTAGIGNDPKLWTQPLHFRPARFLDEERDVDITGGKQIKMIPFGAGRRICPGLGVGTLHIKLMVARMVQTFQWLSPPPPHPPLDLTEHYAFTVVMKNPLKCVIKPRH